MFYSVLYLMHHITYTIYCDICSLYLNLSLFIFIFVVFLLFFINNLFKADLLNPIFYCISYIEFAFNISTILTYFNAVKIVKIFRKDSRSYPWDRDLGIISVFRRPGPSACGRPVRRKN